MKRIPRILNCAAVKVFAELDGETGKPGVSPQADTPAALLHEKINQVAICQENESKRYVLYLCDTKWKILQSNYYENLTIAMREAEILFPALRGRWLEPHRAALEQGQSGKFPYCSFCGKKFSSMNALVVGDHACICHACLANLYTQTRTAHLRAH